MIKTIVGEPTFWSPNGTLTSLNLREIQSDQLNDPNFTEQELRSFENEPTFGILEEPFRPARTYGGSAKPIGRYCHIRNFPDAVTAAQRLAIKPEWNNSCENSATVEIPTGTPICFGKIKDGEEIQVYVHSLHLLNLKIFEPNIINDQLT